MSVVKVLVASGITVTVGLRLIAALLLSLDISLVVGFSCTLAIFTGVSAGPARVLNMRSRDNLQ